MTDMNRHHPLEQEWTALQAHYEGYESGGLHIKLLSMVMTALWLALSLHLGWLCTLVAMLWLQEGVFRTFQSRLGQRILRVETLIRQSPTTPEVDPHPLAFQLHSEWAAHRKGTLGLIREYLGSASRPTVAYPYVPILLGLAVWGVAQYCRSIAV